LLILTTFSGTVGDQVRQVLLYYSLKLGCVIHTFSCYIFGTCNGVNILSDVCVFSLLTLSIWY